MEGSNLFKNKTVGDIFPLITPVITVKTTTPLAECLKIMHRNGIQSVPVLDEKLKLAGILEVTDIALYICSLFVIAKPLVRPSKQALEEVGKRFDSTPAVEVIKTSNSVVLYQDKVFPVKRSTPIQTLLDAFFQGIHRVPLMSDDDTTLMGLITQFDMLTIVAECSSLIDESIRQKPLKEIDLGEKDVISVHKRKTVIEVLNTMTKAKKSPVSAIPVIDDEGKIIANFSASDLKTLNRSNFDWLVLPVLEYLHRIRDQESKQFHRALEAYKSLHPITWTENSTFQSVVMLIFTNKIHRVWLVNEDNKPKGVVSIGDLFKVFLPWAFPIIADHKESPSIHISYENKTTTVSMS